MERVELVELRVMDEALADEGDVGEDGRGTEGETQEAEAGEEAEEPMGCVNQNRPGFSGFLRRFRRRFLAWAMAFSKSSS